MAVIPRFQQTAKGAILITGNTMGLAGVFLGEGIINFTVGNPPAPPDGLTTTVWQDNSAAAFVDLPTDSNVLYAELTWSGQFDTSIAPELDNPITFESPIGTNSVTPDPITAQTVTVPVGTFYVRSQDVTDIIKSSGSGMYTVRDVPGYLGSTNDYLGWCLIIAFSNNLQPFRNMTIWSLLAQISGSSSGIGTVDVPISNFATPPQGNVKGRLVVAAGGGNPNLTGDFLQFGPSIPLLATLSGPNNNASNFFASQINNGNSLSPQVGELDTAGTFGNVNSVPPNPATKGDRNSFDITNVDISSGLTNNQTSGIVRFGTASDTYQAIALGVQIDVNAPILIPVTKTADIAFAEIGDVINYTISLTNTGNADAENSIFIDTIPNGTTFVPNSLTINGIPNSGNPSPPAGISIGNISPNDTFTISFNVLVTTIPSPNPIVNISSIGYVFTPGAGLNNISGVTNSNSVSTVVNHVDLNQTKLVNKAFANVEDTIIYNIRISNTGSTTANNIIFSDTIPNDVVFIPSSVKIDGISLSGVNPNPPGFTLPNGISAGGTSTVEFNVYVNTIPTPNPIINSSTSVATYIIDPSIPRSASTSANSNTVKTKINNANLGNAIKFTDKSFATCSDIITYTIVIPNNGNVTAQNIIFKDTIPNGTTFVTNSVTINGIAQTGTNPSSGVTIPNIAPGATATLTFMVQVQC